ncbi:MAG: hypothetical protein HQL32_15245 [Planctomycetes bacterium]|nr:hypothetical protein [Planctomycetota bacterium]
MSQVSMRSGVTASGKYNNSHVDVVDGVGKILYDSYCNLLFRSDPLRKVQHKLFWATSISFLPLILLLRGEGVAFINIHMIALDDQRSELVGLYPSFRELSGLKVPDHLQGPSVFSDIENHKEKSQ